MIPNEVFVLKKVLPKNASTTNKAGLDNVPKKEAGTIKKNKIETKSKT